MVAAVLTIVLWLALPAFGQQGTGRIEGRLVRSDGSGVGGASVLLNELSFTDITEISGTFSFHGVPAGSYTITFTLGENARMLSNVAVAAGATTRIEEGVDWSGGFVEALTVMAASRRVERIVEAPAAVTSILEAEIEEMASTGQLPKLLEFAPGVEVTQSGLYDYNLNTRGFNSSLNRRIATLVDGRDTSIPFLGSQEWAAVSFPLDDIAMVEFVRGPSAALYGANASSGVVNITTKQPRYSQGGLVRFTTGQLATANVDFRWAGGLGGSWYVKALAGLRNSRDFSVSRRSAAEYSVPCVGATRGDCLPQEVLPLERVRTAISFGGLRADKYFSNGMVATVEGGYADIAGPVLQTGIGRVQVLDVGRPWVRANWHADRFNLLAYYNGRNANRQLALGSGLNLVLDETAVGVESQTNWSFAQKAQVIVGVSAGVKSVDSLDRSLNRQTLLFEPVDSHFEAAFGQVDWNVTDRLKLVLAGRSDFSSLHDVQFSPKGALVYAVDPAHSVRFGYNRAFQVPNFAEFFTQADAAPPTNLGGLNALCAPFGVSCGFGVTRVLAVGNAHLGVETIRTWEVGYKGIFRRKALVTLEYYNSVAEDFITDLLPQLGTPIGRINPNFGPWQSPPGLPAAVATGIRSQVPLLSNNFDGSNVLVAASYTNFGKVDTEGIDSGLNYYLTNAWRVSFGYSWFNFQIKDELLGFASLLLPNSPEHKFSLGAAYRRNPFDAAVNFRWVEGFRWGVGPFVGDVEPYTTVDVVANYALNRNWRVGINIANLFDDDHWEAFGGDLLRRRALTSVAFEW
jgi:outer membrane receptor protein involved in Fe transport